MDVLTKATERAKLAHDAWENIYRKAEQDLDFLGDEPENQWLEGAYAQRLKDGRPALTIDQLQKFVNQVTNDVKMNTPSINVIAHDTGADDDTAEIFAGLIRDIEHNSSADDAYDMAVTMAIKSSIGYIMLDHKYVHNMSFDQVMYIKRVTNPFAILLDPASIQPDGSDARYGFVFDELPESEFKELYPKANPISFRSDGILEKYNDTEHQNQTIQIAEYYEVIKEPIEIGLTIDGKVEYVQEGVEYAATRISEKPVVMRYKLSGEDILEETRFPGKYIPIVPVYGEEAWTKGKRKLHSLIRKAKDAQRMYNYWKSMETELLMKQPKAKVIASAESINGYEDDYLNPDKAMVLRYRERASDGTILQSRPDIIPPPQLPAGVTQASQIAVEDIKNTLGLFDAYIGQKSNETSGVAIAQRKEEGARSTYHFGDNLVKSITQVGRILVCAIPEIYDTPRLINIIGQENNSQSIMINSDMLVEGQNQPYYLDKGQYTVRVTTGASYATQRQYAAQTLQEIVRIAPELMQIVGDLMFDAMDIPNAKALSARMKKVIPPNIIDEEGKEQDPQVAQLQQALQQAQVQLQEMQAALEQAQNELQVKMFTAESKAKNDEALTRLKEVELALKQKELEIDEQFKRVELQLKALDISAKMEQHEAASEKNTLQEVEND